MTRGFASDQLAQPAVSRAADPTRAEVLLQKLTSSLPPPEDLKALVLRSLAASRKIRPGFADAWIMVDVPARAEVIANYRLPGALVQVLAPADGSSSLYHLVPDEFALPMADLALLRDAMADVRQAGGREVHAIPLGDSNRFVTEHATAFLQARLPGGAAGHEKARALAHVTARYTVGLGVLEHLLSDARVTDVYSDAPVGGQPLYVSMNLGDERVTDRLATNVTLCPEAVSSLVTRARLEGGRPFSEARPYLEHDLKEFGARLTVIGPPVSPAGVAAAIRRHSASPLTLVQLVAAGTLSPMTAGLLSVMVEGQCSLLIGGSRGAGKTTLLGALMLEMDPCKRIITIEDTLELPAEAMRTEGYRVQSMRVRSALGGEGEMTAEEALRVSLRLGESAIIVGEVRGQEAQTLYEAMRTGAATSSVMGTIHGSPASAVCARAIHDLGVSPESFASTDAIVIAGLVRPGGARRQIRRITEVAEVSLQGATVEARNLLRDVGPTLEPTEATLIPSTVCGRIATAWGVSVPEIIREIKARAELKLRQVALSRALGKPELLRPPAAALLNGEYARLRDTGLRGPTLVQRTVDFARRRWA